MNSIIDPSLQQLEHNNNFVKVKCNRDMVSQDMKNASRSTNDLPITLRKKSRPRTQYPINKYVSYYQLNKQFTCFIFSLFEVVIFNIVAESQADYWWYNAVKEQMTSLMNIETWNKDEIPKVAYLVGSRQLYIIKFKVDGLIKRCKVQVKMDLVKGMKSIIWKHFFLLPKQIL